MAIQQNQTTKQLLGLLEYKVKQIFTEIKDMKAENSAAHKEVKDDLRFIKNNIFDPNEGIWAEVKENTAFRKETNKYKNAFGLGFFGLIGKHIYDIFKNVN